MKFIIIIIFLISSYQQISSKSIKASQKPAMGWNSWNKFACKINETIIKNAADQVQQLGLQQIGYKYINIDDCWAKSTRNDQNELQEDNVKFPSGFINLSDYLHQNGFFFGIYSSAGVKTCEGFPASLHNEMQDARTFAKWGVDYLKYDNCFNEGIDPQIRYKAMSDALQSLEQPILYSICNWGEYDPQIWGPSLSNSWRTSTDIKDFWESMLYNIDHQSGFWRNVGINKGWNDPDMLEVGNGGMTFEEYKSHFSLWSITKAPLIIGCDLSNISEETLSILSNKEVIDINQDDLGIQARRIWSDRLDNSKSKIISAPCIQINDQKWVYDHDTQRIVSQQGECLTKNDDQEVFVKACEMEPSFDEQFILTQDGQFQTAFTKECFEKDFSQNQLHINFCEKTPSFVYIDNEIKINDQCITIDRDAPKGKTEVWGGPIVDGYAVLLFNRDNQRLNINFDFKYLQDQNLSYRIRDLWSKEDLGIFIQNINLSVESHGVRFLKLQKN